LSAAERGLSANATKFTLGRFYCHIADWPLRCQGARISAQRSAAMGRFPSVALCDTLVLGCHRVLKSWKSMCEKGCPCSNPMLEYQ
jgi:hypothetical protein